LKARNRGFLVQYRSTGCKHYEILIANRPGQKKGSRRIECYR
jgi:hypothetical protein